jgi:hypothetical protein
MGFFKKVGLAFSGFDGQVEANIINAFNYLEKEVSKDNLIKFHNKSPIPFLAFSYAIARECYLSIHPESRYASEESISEDGKKLALVTKETLDNMGYQITIDVFLASLEQDLDLFDYGEAYMLGVLEKNKLSYMKAITDAASIIRRNS